ncbi:MAG: hypothetical protein AB1414_15490 [bacterium]
MIYQKDREIDPWAKLRKDNLQILQQELTDKKVLIKSNVYFDRKERTYLVKEVKEEYIKSKGRLIPGFRLVNEDVNLEEQPVLKYPTSLIDKMGTGKNKRLVLSYTSEINFDRDFRQLHRDTRPDLEIYIYY